LAGHEEGGTADGLHGPLAARGVSGELVMSHFHLHRPPPKVPWWQKYWDSFRANFPGRSSEQARSFALTLILFAAFLFFTRLYFSWRGIPV